MNLLASDARAAELAGPGRRAASAVWSRLRRPELSTDVVVALASAFFLLAANGPFWDGLLAGRDLPLARAMALRATTGCLLFGLQTFVLLLVAHRRVVKPLLIGLFVIGAVVLYFERTFHTYFDPTMLRNVVATDAREARDLVVWRMAPYLLLEACLPIALLIAVRLRRDSWRRAVWRRAGALLAALGLAALGAWSAMHELTPLLRERKALRYLVNPGSAIYSLLAVISRDVRAAEAPRSVVAPDAVLAPRVAGERPRAVVLVVGETVRAGNWGLQGYARQTTPRLAARGDVVSFSDAESCGTSTEVSVPCMFSASGRRDYDEDRIRGSESLLHVLSRAGVEVLWRDNQSGCKGVCAGLPFEVAGGNAPADLCGPEGCLDEVLLDGLRERVDAARGDILIVLHAMGNHGPAYFARYPPSFRRFEPTCDTTDLASCSRDAVVNTYDNAVGYTDEVLARAVETLEGVTSHDTALLYVSDHGESLGERGLFLHGVPFVIAPREQTAIPFVAWLSRDLRASLGIDDGCVSRRAAQPVSHDNLFSTVLGLYDVRSAALERDLDVFAACRG